MVKNLGKFGCNSKDTESRFLLCKDFEIRTKVEQSQ